MKRSAAGRLRYVAFISYSQKDKKHASRLQRALESYRVPRGVEGAELEGKRRSLGKFFRDDDEMGAAADLGAALKGAIADSENLIVVCSPDAAASRWVNEEVLHFRRTGRGDRIFAVIVAGDPKSEAAGAGCFPPALHQTLDDGARVEPLAIDVRKEGWKKSSARVVAGLIRVPFDALWRRERRRALGRAIRTSVLALAGSIVLAAGSLWLYVQSETSYSNALISASQSPQISQEQRLKFAILAERHAAFDQQTAGENLEQVLRSAGPAWTLQTVLEGSREVQDAAFATSDTVIGAGSNNELKVWSVTTGRQTRSLRSRAVGTTHLSVDRSGTRVAVSHSDVVTVFDIERDAPLQSVSHRGVQTAALSPNGSMLATTGEGVTWLWDVRTGQRIGADQGIAAGPSLSLLRGGGSVEFSADGARIAIASDGGSVRVWELATRRFLNTLRLGGDNSVQDSGACATYSANGARIAAVALSGVGVWDASSLQHLSSMEAPAVRCPSLSPDGEFVATLGVTYQDQKIRTTIWDATAGRPISVLPGSTDWQAISPSFDRLGSLLLADAPSGEVGVWRRVETPEVRFMGTDAHFESMSLSRDGMRAVTRSNSTLGAPAVAQIWNLSSGNIMTLPVANVQQVEMTADGHHLVLVSDYTPWLYDTTTGQPVRNLRETRESNFHLSPDQKHAVIVTHIAEGKISLRTTGNDVEIASWPGNFYNEYVGVSFSPDGAVLVLTYGASSRIWNLRSNTLMAELPAGEIRFSANGGRMALLAPDRTEIWDLVRGRRVHQFDFPRSELVLGLSPTADRLVTSSEANGLRIWNAETGQLLVTLDPLVSAFDASFSADGRLLAVRHDFTLTIWDLERNAKLAQTYAEHSDSVFSPDGRRLILIDHGRNAFRILDISLLLAPNWRYRRGISYLAELICARRLTLGRSIITEDDAFTAPALRGHVGEDVCAG